MIRRGSRAAGAVGALALAACGGGAEPARIVRADSAGVEIVTVTPPVEGEPRWRIDSIPTVDIGADQDDPNQALSRPLGPYRLSDGRILVGEPSLRQLRFFGSDGRWLQSVGRQGSGPGEFPMLRRLSVGRGDTIIVEWGPRSLSILDPQGVFVRNLHLVTDGDALTAPLLEGALPDGGLLMAAATGQPLPRESGVHRTALQFWRYSSEGAPVGSAALAESPGAARLFSFSTPVRPDMVIGLDVFPFSARSFSAVSGSSVVIGATDRFGYEQVNWESGSRRLVRVDAPLAPLATDLVEAEADRMLETRSGLDDQARAALRARFVDAARQQSTTLPPVDRIVAAQSGDIWVAETQPNPTGPIRYLVFDSTGSWRGRAVGPPRFQLTWVGTESVLGLWLDPDDVPHVRGYRLISAP